MISFFKKLFKSSTMMKSVVELKHKDGDTIKITIEGSNAFQVAYVSNRVKQIFNLKSEKKFDPKMYEEMNKFWKQADELWNNMDKVFGDESKKY